MVAYCDYVVSRDYSKFGVDGGGVGVGIGPL